jgi:hypothetical protein
MRRRRPKIPKKKNEKATGVYLKELFPDSEIVEQFYVREKIYDGSELIRNYTIIDFKMIIGGIEHWIEFDGSQHHRSVKKWGGKERLRKQRIRDQWVRDYCSEKGIKLIQIDGRKIRGKKIMAYLKSVMKR